MSLINDALKRAKDAQQKSQPAAPGPEFRRAEPVAAQKRGLGMLVPLVIAVIAILGLLFAWQSRQKTAAREPMVEPKAATPMAIPPEPKPIIHEMPTSTPAAVPVIEKPVPTAAPVVSAPAPDLRLQAVFFSPGHSSAIISGKTVRVGNSLKGYRVAAITETSATLVSATETNVMTLEQ